MLKHNFVFLIIKQWILQRQQQAYAYMVLCFYFIKPYGKSGIDCSVIICAVVISLIYSILRKLKTTVYVYVYVICTWIGYMRVLALYKRASTQHIEKENPYVRYVSVCR